MAYGAPIDPSCDLTISLKLSGIMSGGSVDANRRHICANKNRPPHAAVSLAHSRLTIA